VTFIFRYRPIGKTITNPQSSVVDLHPLETLRADGIAPPAPKAPPKPEDIIDLSEEVDSDVEEAGADEEIQRLEVRRFYTYLNHLRRFCSSNSSDSRRERTRSAKEGRAMFKSSARSSVK